MKFPRWVHRVWARVFGYFWSPCPECGEMFGGHEWRAVAVHEKTGLGVCPRCEQVVHARNMAEIRRRLSGGQS